MATNDSYSDEWFSPEPDIPSKSHTEWFSQKPDIIPGQLDLMGTAGAEPDSPPPEAPKDGTGPQSRVKRQRRRRGKGKPQPAPERPASLQRPPSRPMTVAEVVQRRLEANSNGGTKS